MKILTNLLRNLSGWVDKKTPGQGGRTAVIAIGGLLYGIAGLLAGHLEAEAAGQIVLGSLGLIYASNHKR